MFQRVFQFGPGFLVVARVICEPFIQLLEEPLPPQHAPNTFQTVIRTRFAPTLEEFVDLRSEAEALGFAGVMSGPLVRSSYRAGRLYAQAIEQRAGTAAAR